MTTTTEIYPLPEPVMEWVPLQVTATALKEGDLLVDPEYGFVANLIETVRQTSRTRQPRIITTKVRVYSHADDVVTESSVIPGDKVLNIRRKQETPESAAATNRARMNRGYVSRIESAQEFLRNLKYTIFTEQGGHLNSFNLSDLLEAQARADLWNKVGWIAEHNADYDHAGAVEVVVKEATEHILSKSARGESRSTSAVSNVLEDITTGVEADFVRTYTERW